MRREPDPCEQIDFGEQYKARRSNSPDQRQDVTVKIDGGGIAIAISIFATACAIAAWVLIPQINAARTEAEIARATQSLAIQAQAARDVAWLSQQSSKITSEQMKVLQVELAKNRIFVQLDGHSTE